MVTARFAEHDDEPKDDRILLLRNVTWADFQRMQEMRGDGSLPRLAYLEGVLELMSPSREHESLTSWIGDLVTVWCLERGVEYSKYGSWTLEDKQADRGAEPDECFVFGPYRDPKTADLAIEVIWTSGGLDKRQIYKKLGVRELWFWRRGVITVFVLRDGEYVEVAASDVLPGIDLAQLASFLDRPTTSQAVREYRAALTGK